MVERDLRARYINFMKRTEYPKRLHHSVPGWVSDGAVYHIRIRCAERSEALTNKVVGTALLESIRIYVGQHKWSCFLFLLMPDHVHGLISFSRKTGMSRIIGNWKRYASSWIGIKWQANYFDHRIRTQKEFEEKFQYIRRNPVVKGLCAEPDNWPWQVIATHVLPQF